MINKKYKCPSCGKDVKCDVIRVPGTGFENPLYQYLFTCELYACDMPFRVAMLYEKPDNEKVADKLYEYWVKEYKKYLKEKNK